MKRPYTKSINERGNDVYKGVGRNATLPGSHSVTLVTEVTKSETEAKQVYDKAVNEKLANGYTIYSDLTARYKASNPDYKAAWVGSSGQNEFACTYYYSYVVDSWVVEQQSFAMT
jgi:hypothetical protein